MVGGTARLVLAIYLSFTALQVSAQNLSGFRAVHEYSRWEAFGGFSYAHVNLGTQTKVFLPESQNYYGIHLAAAFNPSAHMRVRVLDFAVQMGPTSNPEPSGLSADLRTFQMLVGPEFVARSPKASVFAHTLVGLTNTRLVESVNGQDLVPDLARRTNLAFGAGGGLDLRLSPRFSYRAFEADYIPTRLAGNWENHVRVSTGVIYRFGSNVTR